MSLIDAIPQSIKDVGRARASGAAASGAYGQSIADIGQLIARIPAQNAERRSRALKDEVNQLELTTAKRKAAADIAIQNAMSQALGPDGEIDEQKMAAHLAGTPAASQLPQIIDSFTKMKANRLGLEEGQVNLQNAKLKGKEAEDDEIGQVAHIAAQVDSPDDQAGLLATGIASSIARGRITKERGNELLANVLGDDGNPDPMKVKQAITTMTAGSKEQRTLASTEAQRRNSEENTASLKAQREALTEDRKAVAAERALKNYAAQLASATTQDRYARIYQGIPEEQQAYFDTPETWTPDSSAHAGTVMMTPAERESMRRDADTANYRERELGVQGKNAEANMLRARASAARVPAETDAPEYKRYKDFAAQYEKARDEERQRTPMVYDEAGQQAIADHEAAKRRNPNIKPLDMSMFTKVKGEAATYQPPPSFEKWQAMTAPERAAVMTTPSARISDAELAKRAGGTPAETPATPKLSAPEIKQQQMKFNSLSADQQAQWLTRSAAEAGLTLEQVKKKVRDAGYVVK